MKYSGRTSSKKIEQCNDLINSFEKRKDKIKSLSDIAKLELAPKKNLPPKVAKRPPLIPRQKKIVAPMANSPMLDSKIIELRVSLLLIIVEKIDRLGNRPHSRFSQRTA